MLTFFLFLIVCLGLVGLVLILARLDIFFTIAEEGTAKAILALGGFSRVIMQYRGKIINDQGEVVDGQEFHFFGGLRWLGIPFYHSLYKYHFRWKTLRVQTGEIVPRDEKISYILVKDDVYVVEIKNAESKGMVPLDIILLLTARCINPYKALFKAQDWMEMVINRSEALFREYVNQFDFEELVGRKQKAGEEIWEKLAESGLTSREKVGEEKKEGLFQAEYGIDIRGVEMRDINPSGEYKKTYEEAASKEWQAKQEAKRVVTIADAEKNRIETVYETIKKYGDLGKSVRFMESLDTAGKNPGSWIIPFDLRQILGGLFGSKPPDDDQPQGGNK